MAMAEVVLGGGAGGFNWLPVYIAQRKGMFERHGIAVSTKRTGAVDKTTAAVKSGELHIGISPPEGAIKDFAAGGSLRIIAANVNRLPLSLVANPRFDRIEDLKGARLGTSSLTEGTALYTMEMLSKHGLRYPGDYEFAVVGVHPARWRALQEGTIDAAVQLIPLNYVAFDAGYKNFGEVSDYIPEIVFTALMVDQTWADANRMRVLAVLRGIIEGTAWLYDPANNAAALELVAEITQTEEKYAQTSLDFMRTAEIFPRDLSIPPAAFAKSLELMQKAKLADQSMVERVNGVLDDAYRVEAVRAG